MRKKVAEGSKKRAQAKLCGAGAPSVPRQRQTAYPVGYAFFLAEKWGFEVLRTPLAVPGKIFGLALFLDFSDRCASKPSLHRPPDALGLAARDGTVAWVQIRFIKDKRHTLLGMPFAWRRRGDLNPRDGHPPYSLSRGASSPLEYFSTVKIFCVYSLRSRHGKTCSGAGALDIIWRRERDSNPRPFRVPGFQDRLHKPLGHLSVSESAKL